MIWVIRTQTGKNTNGDSVKIFKKAVGMVFVGLFFSGVVYPFLHEIGHALTAIIVGAKVLEFHLFPIPFVACDISGCTQAGQLILGMGGIVLPFAFSMCLKSKKFWLWYGCFILKETSLCMVVFSLLSVFCYTFGTPLPMDDVSQILQLIPNGALILFFILVVMFVYGVVKICKEKPLLRSETHFKTDKNAII